MMGKKHRNKNKGQGQSPALITKEFLKDMMSDGKSAVAKAEVCEEVTPRRDIAPVEYITSESQSQTLGDEDSFDLGPVVDILVSSKECSDAEDDVVSDSEDAEPAAAVDLKDDTRSLRSNKSGKSDKPSLDPWVDLFKVKRAPEKGFQLQEIPSDGDEGECELDLSDEVEVGSYPD